MESRSKVGLTTQQCILLRGCVRPHRIHAVHKRSVYSRNAPFLQSQDSEDTDDPEIPKFNPMLMKKRGGEAHSQRQADSKEPRLTTLSQMPSGAASTGGMSDDDGMSNFETPSGNQESKLRY